MEGWALANATEFEKEASTRKTAAQAVLPLSLYKNYKIALTNLPAGCGSETVLELLEAAGAAGKFFCCELLHSETTYMTKAIVVLRNVTSEMIESVVNYLDGTQLSDENLRIKASLATKF